MNQIMLDLQEIPSVIFAQKNADQVIILIGNYVNKPEYFQSEMAYIIFTKPMIYSHYAISFSTK